MNTGSKKRDYQVPSFGRKEAYDFVEDQASLDIYRELNQIAEEIEKCRQANC